VPPHGTTARCYTEGNVVSTCRSLPHHDRGAAVSADAGANAERTKSGTWDANGRRPPALPREQYPGLTADRRVLGPKREDHGTGGGLPKTPPALVRFAPVVPDPVAAANRVAERRRALALARHFRQAEGLSIGQIADRLGRSPATIRPTSTTRLMLHLGHHVSLDAGGRPGRAASVAPLDATLAASRLPQSWARASSPGWR
jgi:hypothetical protein